MAKTEKEFYYILSDIHIGTNDRVNWFQKEFHGKYLSNILTYITNEKRTRDVIINGDWLEEWVYQSQTQTGASKYMVKRIISANPELFTPSDARGNFISLNNSISGNLCFVNGNHDMGIKTEDINCVLKLNKPIVKCGDHYENKEIYAEHGHLYTTLNRPYEKTENIYGPLPLGYYITRVCADLSRKQLNGTQTAADLEDHGLTVMTLIKKHKMILARLIFKRIKENRSNTYILICFLIAVLYADADIYDIQGVKEFVKTMGRDYFDRIVKEYKYLMPDLNNISAEEAIRYFRKLTINPISEHVMCDFTRDLSTYGYKLSRKYKNQHRIFALGHTHLSVNMYMDQNKSIYVNSGFMCPDKPSFAANKRKLTFIEIEKEQTSSGYYYTVRIKEINKDFVIKTHSARKIRGRF